jgi:hypothetical protein
MIRVFDFECSECGNIEEKYISSDTRTSLCSKCNQQSNRLLAMPRSKLDPHSGDFAGATIKWAKQRQKQIEIERKTQ